MKGETVDPEDKVFEISKDQSSLTLSEADVKDTGVYSCVATNNAGKDVKETYITVLGKCTHLGDI